MYVVNFKNTLHIYMYYVFIIHNTCKYDVNNQHVNNQFEFISHTMSIEFGLYILAIYITSLLYHHYLLWYAFVLSF